MSFLLGIVKGLLFAWSWIVKIAKAIFAWFVALSPIGKLLVVLALATLLNIWQFVGKLELEADLEKAKADCIKAADAENKRGKEVHNEKQNILDYFVQKEKIDSDAKLHTIETKVEKVKVVYAKVKADAPLPVDCKFDNLRVQTANEAIDSFTTGSVQDN